MRIWERFIKQDKIRQLFTFPRFLLLMILVGIIMRIFTFFTDIPRFDGAFYSTVGYNIATQQDFIGSGGEHTYSFSLTYPPYLAIFYNFLGFSIPVTQMASIIMSIIVLGVAYITTADLLDKQKALVVTAIIALLPPLITATGKNYIENIVLLFFIPAMWAILKSFEDSRYIIPASFFAGLTYYTKTDIGSTIVIVAMVAYGIWRFYHIRWGLLKDKNYYIAFIILLAMVLLRAYMVSTTSTVIYKDPGGKLSNVLSYEGILKFAVQTLYHAILIGGFFIFWKPELKRSILEIKKENAILLLSSLGLMMSIVIHACGYPLFSIEPIQRVSREYSTIVYVPLLWLFLYNKNIDNIALKANKLMAFVLNMIVSIIKNRKKLLLLLTGLFLAVISVLIDDFLPILYFFGAFALIITPLRERIVLLLIAFLILSANALTAQYRPAYVDIADDINRDIEKGDVIALARKEDFIRLSPDRIYPFITERDVSFEIYNHSNVTDARFIISEFNDTFIGYELKGTYRGSVKPSFLKNIVMTLLGREDRYQQSPLYLWERV